MLWDDNNCIVDISKTDLFNNHIYVQPSSKVCTPLTFSHRMPNKQIVQNLVFSKQNAKNFQSMMLNQGWELKLSLL